MTMISNPWNVCSSTDRRHRGNAACSCSAIRSCTVSRSRSRRPWDGAWTSTWSSVPEFVREVDHGRGLFQDFVLRFYPVAKDFLDTHKPYPGYYYSPTFARGGEAAVFTMVRSNAARNR